MHSISVSTFALVVLVLQIVGLFQEAHMRGLQESDLRRVKKAIALSNVTTTTKSSTTTKATTKATITTTQPTTTTTQPPIYNPSNRTGSRVLTDQQISATVDTHNNLRIQTNASYMSMLEWDDVLANLAQNWSNGCMSQHRPLAGRTNVGDYYYVGENMFASTSAVDPVNAVPVWYEEKNYYIYENNTCMPGKICGHYTQVVWADTTDIGCGVTFCPNLYVGTLKGAWLVVCDYGEGGNWQGEWPYYRD